ncbi:hypothetical protein LO763_20470 [Glycomyces sp. A-F 0318]|uniref:hypothetical protein n=1 Tax=Glycomyces amatae TaxID=2881355 RepID=UPI001E443CC2|nr:hypothetical protein [Glycomyces amatae]MCD0445990.1 hypothetical protein [Glycomyces amatae]
MFHLELTYLYIAALTISAVAVTAKAWFDYKSVRYREDTKRLRQPRPARLEPSQLDAPDPEEE